MIAAVTSWCCQPQDDNEADAIVLLHLKMTELGCVGRQGARRGRVAGVIVFDEIEDRTLLPEEYADALRRLRHWFYAGGRK